MNNTSINQKPMKVVGVISSFHKDGNGATLTREALKAAAAMGAEVSEIQLAEHHLQFCVGCMKCTEGACPLSDDFIELREKIYEADGVIFCSPTFAGGPNAVMKNFMDRLGMYERFTSGMGGKYFVGISTGSNMGADKVAKELAKIGTSGVFERGFMSDAFGVSLGIQRAADNEKAMTRAKLAGEKLVVDWQKKRKHPFQNIPMRILNRFVLKSKFQEIIIKNSESTMKAVYENLRERKLIPEK